MMTAQCRLKPGWTVAYRDTLSRQLHDGTVDHIDLTENQLVIQLRSGLTITGQQICSVGEVDASGQVVAAYAAREKDLLVPVDSSEAAADARVPTNPWLEPWRRVAAATHGITATEPRLRPILQLLEQCDLAYQKQNQDAFGKAEQRLAQFLTASTPRSRPQPSIPDSHTA
jgi:hypothetical protein